MHLDSGHYVELMCLRIVLGNTIKMEMENRSATKSGRGIETARGR